MSLATEHHTRHAAANMTAKQIREWIAQIQSEPQWKGDEFDDVRVRHKRHTRLKTLRAILADRETT